MQGYGKIGTEVATDSYYKKRKTISILLISYIYMPYFWNICEYSFGLPTVMEYLAYLLLAVVPIFIYPKIKQSVLILIGCFAIILAINYAVVSYRYYVFVEGVQALIGVTVPCICITNRYFKINDFLKRWYKFAIHNVPLVIVAILLFRMNLVHYSIFTSICVPNVFIISYGIMEMKANKKSAIVISVLNIIATVALGGRIAAVVCITMLVLAYLFSRDISFIKKLIFIILLLIVAFLLIENLNSILAWLSQQLNSVGIKSRSITLLIEQLNSHELYTTNRDKIYSLTIEYIKDRSALPGGFGVALNLTSGEYYYVHNLFLQLLVVFGGIGTVIIIGTMVVIFYKLKYKIPKSAYRLLTFMLLAYLIIGFIGSSFFVHYLATIFIALFFFGETVLLEMEV